MARITVEDCIDKFESRFELVLVASNRARRLHSGENPTVEKDNDKNTVIALREIADETLPIDELKNNLIEEYQTVSLQNEEDLTSENIDSQDDDSVEEKDLTSENIDSQDDDSVEEEIKEDALEIENYDNSESTIEEITDQQDAPDENNEEISNKTDQSIEGED